MSIHLNILVCTNLHYTSAKRLLKGCKHFSQSFMVFVAVSKFGKTDLDQELKLTVSITVITYSSKELLPNIRRLSNDDFVYVSLAHTPFTLRYHSHLLEFIEPGNWPPNRARQ